MKEILWAAAGGAVVYWWLKRKCPCNDHAPAAPVVQQQQVQTQSTGGLDDSQGAPAITAPAAGVDFIATAPASSAAVNLGPSLAGCTTCSGSSAPSGAVLMTSREAWS